MEKSSPKTNNKIRVALMTATIDGRKAAGTAVVARKCIESLLERGDEFDLTFIHYEKTDDAIYHHGIREVIIPTFRFAFINRRFFRLIYYFLTTKDRYDIVHWFQSRLYPFFWWAPAKHIVVTLHGAGDWKNEDKFIFSRFVMNWTARLFNRKISMAIAGSDYAKKDIVRWYAISPQRVTVIHNGVDTSYERASDEKIAGVKKKYQLPDKFFLGMARLIPTKNVIRTIQAFELFSSSGAHRDMHFVHVGSEGSDGPRFEAILQTSDARQRMHHIRYVEQGDLAAFYSAAFALVIPLLNEGFCLPAIEGMACGTPTIISNTATPGIDAGEAMLVDALDERSIADAMSTLVNDPELRENVIQKGLAKARTLTWKETGNKLIAIYQRLVAQK